ALEIIGAAERASEGYLDAFSRLVAERQTKEALIAEHDAKSPSILTALEGLVETARSNGSTQAVYLASKALQSFAFAEQHFRTFQLTRVQADALAATQEFEAALEHLARVESSMGASGQLTTARSALTSIKETVDTTAELTAQMMQIGKEELDVIGPELKAKFAAFADLIKTREIEIGPRGQATLESASSLTLTLGVLTLLLGIVLSFVIGRSVTRPLGQLMAVLSGDSESSGEIPGIERKDEYGELAKAIAAGEVTKVEALRIQRGLDNSSALLMLADINFDIVFASNALTDTLRKRQAEIRREIPQFDVEALIGSSFETFQKLASQQGGGISATESTQRTRLNVGSVIFSLVVSPVRDDAGARIGTVVEWRDVTDEVRATTEIDAMVRASVDGDFSRRIELSYAPKDLREMGERLNQVGEAVERAVEEACRALGKLADGDLTDTMQGEFGGSFHELQQGVNASIGQVSKLVGGIQGSVTQMNSATDEIAQGAVALSSRTETQASSIQETVATMEEITATIKANAENSHAAGKMSVETAQQAERGGAVVEETVAAISRIESASAKIADIVGVIDSIAFQTNLLALNAAVEAARAGDAGKGFAVVASEVRTLAQQSADAAKNIKDVVAASGSEVSEGVRLVNLTGQALTEIISGVNKVARTIEDISAASREQATGVEEITTSINYMDQMTQKNAQMADESASASQRLATEGSRLAEQMRFFTLQSQPWQAAPHLDEGDADQRLSDAMTAPAAAVGKADSPSGTKAADDSKAPAAKPAASSEPPAKSAASGPDPQSLLKASGEDWSEF
ncbi:MAG: methyl-accepting chemotaxis protein, partial [Pseudomonadota bacterium]